MAKNSLMNPHNDKVLDLVEQLKDYADYVIVDKKRNTTTIQVKRDEYIVKADVKKFSGSETRSVSVTPTNLSQDIKEKTVMERLNSGERQVDVALEMGLSQSRIAQIKKKHSK